MVNGFAFQRRRAASSDRHEFFDGSFRFAMAAQALQTFAQSFLDGMRHGLAGLPGDSLRELVDLGILDVQCHVSSKVEIHLPFFIVTRIPDSAKKKVKVSGLRSLPKRCRKRSSAAIAATIQGLEGRLAALKQSEAASNADVLQEVSTVFEIRVILGIGAQRPPE